MKYIVSFLILATMIFYSGCSNNPTNSNPAPIKPAPKDSMKLIDSSTFTMGAIGSSSDESPTHEVTLAKFYIDTTEVAQAEYKSLTGTNPSRFLDSLKPVESVSWYDAVLFCNARSKRDRLDTVYSYTSITGTAYIGCTGLTALQTDFTKNGYRLPTEAEWEKACRGGTATSFYWGNGMYTRNDTIAVDSNAVWFNNSQKYDSRDSLYGTHRTGSKKPNSLRLYDMAGNVQEWCHDFFGSYSSGAQTNPTGPSTGTEKVIRGGSWGNQMSALRSASRLKMAPQNSTQYVGFRCVRKKVN
ncbi:MAG: SUMF1/EgtB/PvdO family nonheme iron enzyme [Fibrobacteres bacterium]|nr:SUMF1/EgtB/PvdO family nonheme iron enzyme [Fibrobacterota bacterium]